MCHVLLPPNTYAHINKHTRIHKGLIHSHAHTRARTRSHTHMHAHMHTRTCTHAHARTHTQACTCTTHARTHIHAHTPVPSKDTKGFSQHGEGIDTMTVTHIWGCMSLLPPCFVAFLGLSFLSVKPDNPSVRFRPRVLVLWNRLHCFVVTDKHQTPGPSHKRLTSVSQGHQARGLSLAARSSRLRAPGVFHLATPPPGFSVPATRPGWG